MKNDDKMMLMKKMIARQSKWWRWLYSAFILLYKISFSLCLCKWPLEQQSTQSAQPSTDDDRPIDRTKMEQKKKKKKKEGINAHILHTHTGAAKVTSLKLNFQPDSLPLLICQFTHLLCCSVFGSHHHTLCTVCARMAILCRTKWTISALMTRWGQSSLK